jgi:hypothetical protein
MKTADVAMPDVKPKFVLVGHCNESTKRSTKQEMVYHVKL